MRFTKQEILSCISICIGSFLIILDTNIVNIIIPDLKEDLGLTISQTSWAVNSYVLAFASLILLFARVSKRMGAKTAFVLGIVVFMIGSLFCGLSESYPELLVHRVIQGIGAALFAPVATSLLSLTVTEPRKRAVVFGIWSGTSGLGFAFSPIVGGFLNEVWGWQSIFFINIPFTLIVAALGIIGIKDIKKMKVPVYLKEQSLVFVIILSFVFMTHEYEMLFQRSLLLTICLMAALLVLLFIYGKRIRGNLTHVLQRNMFVKLNVSSLINGFTYNFSIYGIMYFLSIYFQDSLHLTSLEAGIKFLPLTLSGMLLSSFLSPILVDKLGTTVTQQLCLLAIMIGSIPLVVYFSAVESPILISISFITLGFSGSIAPVLMNAAFLSTKEEYHNEISSLVNLMRQLGSILGVMIVSILIDITSGKTAILYFLLLTVAIPALSYWCIDWASKNVKKQSNEIGLRVKT